MKNEEIMEAAIKIAIENGYRDDEGFCYLYGRTDQLTVTMKDRSNVNKIMTNIVRWSERQKLEYRIIFDPRFAKKFWGEADYNCGCEWDRGNDRCLNCKAKVWEVEMRKMVTQEEPLKYIEQFLNKEETK